MAPCCCYGVRAKINRAKANINRARAKINRARAKNKQGLGQNKQGQGQNKEGQKCSYSAVKYIQKDKQTIKMTKNISRDVLKKSKNHIKL